MRTLRAQSDMPNSPVGFPFAVSDVRSATESETVAWFKTERDANAFAEGERMAAKLQAELKRAQENIRNAEIRGYSRGVRHSVCTR